MTHLNLLTSTSQLPEKWIEKILDEMLLSYGKKFIDQWSGVSTDKLILHWSQGLSGYSGQEIRRGLDALASKDWPPSLPEFKKLCRPPIDDVVAYYEAVNGCNARDKGEMGTWSHPAIFWAATKIAFDLKTQTYSQVKSRWEIALKDQMEKGEWPAIPEPMLALPEPGKSQLSKEKAAQMLNELGASDAFKPKTDHKLWAKRIVANPKAYPAFSLKCAKEALANKAA